MATPILMPQVGMSVETCIITEWLKKTGDKVEVGDLLFSYETDKSSLEYENTDAGVLLETFYDSGDEVPVLTAVGAIGEAGEDASHLRPSSAEPSTAAQPVPTETVAAPEIVATVTTQVATVTGTTGENVKISPRAKNIAEKQNVDISQAAPTGPYGRVIERDIRTMLDKGIGLMTGGSIASGAGITAGTGIGGRVLFSDLSAKALPDVSDPTYVPFEDVKFSGIRRVIAKNMSASLREIPQLTHNFTFDATNIMEYRKNIKATGEALGLPNITLNDFILYAVSRILPKYPQLNSHMVEENSIRMFKDVHIGMAVDTPRGLMVPVVSFANRRSLAEISIEASTIAGQAIAGDISPDKLSGATFTVSNLGGFGVESFTPVINPPETGLLGIDNINLRPREVNGEIEFYPAMGISLTYDHRAIDGAPASRFASEVCKALENFTVLLAK